MPEILETFPRKIWRRLPEMLLQIVRLFARFVSGAARTACPKFSTCLPEVFCQNFCSLQCTKTLSKINVFFNFSQKLGARDDRTMVQKQFRASGFGQRFWVTEFAFACEFRARFQSSSLRFGESVGGGSLSFFAKRLSSGRCFFQKSKVPQKTERPITRTTHTLNAHLKPTGEQRSRKGHPCLQQINEDTNETHTHTHTTAKTNQRIRPTLFLNVAIMIVGGDTDADKQTHKSCAFSKNFSGRRLLIVGKQIDRYFVFKGEV